MDRKQLVIYHGSCIDGFTAAWCAWRKFGDSAEYVPGIYGQPPPDVTWRDVLIVDYSYPRAVLLEMKERAASLRVLDHHKTAEADLAGLDFCLFDVNRSGAGIAWDELHPSETRPELVDYVEDRDLWRWKLSGSREVNAYIGSVEQTFEAWEKLYDECEYLQYEVIAGGKAILRGIDRYCSEMSKQARWVDFAGHTVPVVNAPYINTSELVGYLAERRPESFAVGWFQRGDGKYQYSLRSRGDFDVSEVAKQFGGGGHKNAAGFTSVELVHK